MSEHELTPKNKNRIKTLRELLKAAEAGELARQDDLAQLNERLSETQGEVAKLVTKTNTTQDEIADLRSQIGDLHDRLDGLETGGGGSVDDERLDILLERAHQTLGRVERSIGSGNQFYVGPKSISDDASLHSTAGWGIEFTTDRELYLGDCTIKAYQPGRFTATVYDISGGSFGEPVDRTPIDAIGDEREQEIRLDLHVPPGMYLLTRPVPTSPADAPEWAENLPDYAFEPDDDSVSLAMQEHQPYDRDNGGWYEDNKYGTQWLGKGHPVWGGSPTPFWFYFFSLEVVTAQSAGDLPQQ